VNDVEPGHNQNHLIAIRDLTGFRRIHGAWLPLVKCAGSFLTMNRSYITKNPDLIHVMVPDGSGVRTSIGTNQ
jgi:hypothetical protein